MRVKLRETHPTLFSLYAIAAAMQAWDGLNMLFRPDFFTSSAYSVVLSIAPLWVYGTIAVISAVLLIAGLASGQWTVMRVGFLIAFLYTAFFAFGFWIRYITGETTGATGAGKWTAIAVAMAFILREPPVNLLTVKKAKGGHHGKRSK